MRSLFACFPALACVAVLAAAPDAEAKRSVGLGVGAGVAIPTADTPLALAPAWGFYTDIPLLSSFHITPSTLVYRLEPKEGGTGESATDVSLNFKFMIPIGPLDIFAGVTAGVTSTSKLKPHVGGLAGASLNLVSNLDVFVNVGYKFLIAGEGDLQIHDVQIFAGPLFRFDY